MRHLRAIALPFLLSLSTVAAVTPNPRISRGKPVALSANSYAAANLVDGKFGTAWYYTPNSWAAVQVGAGSSKVLVTWNDVSSNWSDVIPSAGVCKAGTNFPSAYSILTSKNSTDGSDGTWDTLSRVTGNVVASRAHLIDFTGASWVKMLITAGNGGMDELEVYDASNGAADSWFFLGTSITMMTFKSSIADSNVSDLIHARVPANTPSLVRGGVPCINSSQVLTSIKDYLDNMAGSHYVAIEMATNDAWGGGDWNLANYTRNMQAIIDSIRGRGMEPIIARPIATDSARAKWQVHPGYLKVVDSLTKSNRLTPGPDLDAWFRAHPEQLNSDGAHPNAVAAQAIQRLWADAMAKTVYASTPTTIAPLHRSPVQRLVTGSDALGRPRTAKTSGISLDATGAKVFLPKP